MSTSTLSGTATQGADVANATLGDAESSWRDVLDPRGMFVTCLLALSGTVAVVVLTSAVLRLVTGS